MAATTIPEDVVPHLQAVIQLSNRRLQLRLLKEAEARLAQDAPDASVLIAFAVLESAPLEHYPAYANEIERWRAVRNTPLHADSSKLTLEEATEIVLGIRTLITELVPFTAFGQSERGMTVNHLRGKYSHVPTSSAALIERKSEELDLEHSRISGCKRVWRERSAHVVRGR